MSKDYKLRLTVPYADASGVILRIAEQCESIIVYEHSEGCERPHIHALILGLQRSYDTVVGWMKSICPARSDRSLGTSYGKEKKPLDLGFISYMSKGKYDPVYVKGISNDDIAERKGQGYYLEGSKDIVQLELENGKLVRKVSPAKKQQIELLEEMRAELGDIDYDNLYNADEVIYKVIRKVCMRNHYYLPRGLYKLMEFRDNLLMYGNAASALNEFQVAIARRKC